MSPLIKAAMCKMVKSMEYFLLTMKTRSGSQEFDGKRMFHRRESRGNEVIILTSLNSCIITVYLPEGCLYFSLSYP